MTFLLSIEDVASANASVKEKSRTKRAIAWAPEVLTALEKGSALLPAGLWLHKSHGVRFQREFKAERAGWRIAVEKLFTGGSVLYAVRLSKVRDV